jgi:hypothetical protein
MKVGFIGGDWVEQNIKLSITGEIILIPPQI